MLTAAAEWEGLVVVTFDTDFKTLIKQVPVGHRTQFKARAGRISLTMEETKATARLEEMLPIIEFVYSQCLDKNRRFIMQISLTSFTSPF